MDIISLSKTTIDLFVIAFFRIMCKCVSCDSRKRTPSEWERHTGSRAKKWKYSVKVKSTMLPLEKWVCISSFYIRVITNMYAGFECDMVIIVPFLFIMRCFFLIFYSHKLQITEHIPEDGVSQDLDQQQVLAFLQGKCSFNKPKP